MPIVRRSGGRPVRLLFLGRAVFSLAIAIVTGTVAAQSPDCFAVRPLDRSVISALSVDSKGLLVGTVTQGLWRVRSDRFEASPIIEQPESIDGLARIGGGTIVLSNRRLLILPDGADSARAVVEEVADGGSARLIESAGGATFLTASGKRSLRFESTENFESFDAPLSARDVTVTEADSRVTIIGTRYKGLLRTDSRGNFHRVLGVPSNASITRIARSGKGFVVGTEEGAWTVSEGGSSAEPLLGFPKCHVTTIMGSSRGLYIGTMERGVWLKPASGGSCAPVRGLRRGESIEKGFVWNSLAMIVASGHPADLYGVNGDRFSALRTDHFLEDLRVVFETPTRLVFAATEFVEDGDGNISRERVSEARLFLLSTDDSRVRLSDGSPPMPRLKNVLRWRDRVFVGTQSGLYGFSLGSQAAAGPEGPGRAGGKPWDASLEIGLALSTSKITPASAKVTISGRDVPGLFSAKTSQVEVVLRNHTGQRVGEPRLHSMGEDINVILPDTGEYDVAVRGISPFGDYSLPALSPKVSVFKDPAEALVRELGAKFLAAFMAAGGAWLVATLALVIGSRWSRGLFRFVTSPAIPKVLQWYLLMFEYVRPVRHWMLRPILEALAEGLEEDRPFVEPNVLVDGKPAPGLALIRNAMNRSESPQVRRIWLQGRAGTGKTTLLEAYVREVVRASDPLASASAPRAFPLLVRVRDQAGTDVVGAVTQMLEPYGVDDPKMVSRLLRTGDFLLLVDGANEGEWDQAIRAYLERFPKAPMLVTSQKGRPSEKFEPWVLPELSEGFAKQVLKAHLAGVKRESAGLRDASVLDRVPSDLWPELRSAYDVVLLADLLKAGSKLPAGRNGLYEATIDHATTSWTGDLPGAELLALLRRQAWQRWLEGSYVFGDSGGLPEEYMEHLERSHLMRRVGKSLQVRHELMRQYLAATWLVLESPSPEAMAFRLDDGKVWAVGPTHQRDVFRFVCEMQSTKESLQVLANCAGRNIHDRRVLAEEVGRVAKDRSWRVVIPVGAVEGGGELGR